MEGPPLEILLMLAGSAAVAAWLYRSGVRGQGSDPRQSHLWDIFEAWSTLFLVVSMLFACTTQVLTRYLFSDFFSMHWTEELARLLLVWAAMWGAASLQREDDHIRLTLFVDMLPVPAQRLIDAFGDVVVLIVLAVLLWFGWSTAWRLRVMSTVSLGVPISAFALAVSISSTLMFVYTVKNLEKRLRLILSTRP